MLRTCSMVCSLVSAGAALLGGLGGGGGVVCRPAGGAPAVAIWLPDALQPLHCCCQMQAALSQHSKHHSLQVVSEG